MRARLLHTLGRQLGHPSGPFGRLVVRALDRQNEAMVSRAVAAFPAGAADVADVGFGGGLGLRLLLARPATTAVHGVEVADDMLARARSAFADPRLALHHGSLTALPLPDASLDALMTNNTVYFVADLPAALAELARVLRPGGTAVVGVRSAEAMAKLPFTDRGFVLRPTEDVVAAMDAAGLPVADRHHLPDERLPATLLVGRRA